MNVCFLFAAVFFVFIAADILTAKLFKVNRTVWRNVSLIALCVLTMSSVIGGAVTLIRNSDTTSGTLYNAYSYLLEGNADQAAEKAAKVQSPHADMIVLLADCYRGNYASAFINSDDLKNSGKLNKDLSAQADDVYRLSREMTGLEGVALTNEEAAERLGTISKNCFSLLQVSEKKEVEFLSGFKRDRLLSGEGSSADYSADPRFLSELLLETPNDKELLRYSVKYYHAAGGLDMAEGNARKLLDLDRSVDNIVLYTDVIAQKLIKDIHIEGYDQGDPEIAVFIKRAEEAEKAAEAYEEGNPRREENLQKAEAYRKQADGAKARRIINWLTAQAPLFGDRSGIIDLQMSKLYAASGNDAKARELILGLLKRKDKLKDGSPVKAALEQLGDVYYDQSASEEDISSAVGGVLRLEAFLPNSVLNRGYSQLLNNMLKYERASVFISRVNADQFPTVRAYLNVNGKKDGVEKLANDFSVADFTFADNGIEVPVKDVKLVEDDSSNYISIALVVDGSGSMEGDRIENARRAVEACIQNLDAQTQELSIVLYSNGGEILTPLTNDTNKLELGANQINAGGGTVISSGLIKGLETLDQATGVKAIILMTDGEDGSTETMDEAILAAQESNVSVFTVSTGGGNREYMENIAKQTGGTYMEAIKDTDLINVYTALQNYIVNNYCFEYTVSEETESNPRVLTIGLKDYEVASARTYSYGGLVLTKDGSFLTREGSGSLRLLSAEPSVVSAKDAEIGVPVYLHALGATDGAKVFINGSEVRNVRVAGNSVIAFTLSGKYSAGALNVTVKLPDGTSRYTDKLLSISGSARNQSSGQTIVLGGNGNTLYADNVEQKDEYTLKLSGNVILDGFIRTTSAVTVQSNSPITASGGRIKLSGGVVSGSGAAYVNFSASKEANANYGQLAFGGGSAKVLNVFSFYFDAHSITLNDPNTALVLPGFGEVYGDVQYNGSELVCRTNDGQALSALQANLNYAVNGNPLPKGNVSSAAQMITGYSGQNQNSHNNAGGIYANSEALTITVRNDFMSVTGNGTVGGSLGPAQITDGKLSIDTGKSGSMFQITGTVNFNSLPSGLTVSGQVPFSISAASWYPDTVKFNATGLSVNTTGLSDCFISGKLPKALDGAITVKYPLTIENEPYRGQISSLLTEQSLDCDKIEFICSNRQDQNAIKVYASVHPNRYIRFTGNGVELPINEVDELSVFGSELGGEISGTATINERNILLEIDVDGHLDNDYLGVKHDGKSTLTVTLSRNASTGMTFPVTLTFEGKELSYTATAEGNISPEDGFRAYVEGDGNE